MLALFWTDLISTVNQDKCNQQADLGIVVYGANHNKSVSFGVSYSTITNWYLNDWYNI